MKKIIENKKFNENLMLWHKNDNLRSMPWKGEKNPYKIWLSEVILQQTRVEQGLAYYNKFILNYPTVEKLANANENEVFKLWEGLGYYSRCKNLIASARYVAFELAGIFPNTYIEIIKLKGVGPYTAAAIASFAYNLPNAVVDGNVLRVLSRYFGISTPIDSTEGKHFFAELAQSLLDTKEPALYNQAIMDFGATVCKPKLALCLQCVLKKDCQAFKTDEVDHLPVKSKKLIKVKRYFFIVIATYNNKVYVRQRQEKDVWQNLWELVTIEHDNLLLANHFVQTKEFTEILGKNSTIKSISDTYKQQLTHQTIEGIFVHVTLSSPLKTDKYQLISQKEINKLAFPRLITNYFEQKNKIDS
jgi:A/G-specific adenine glycosylase